MVRTRKFLSLFLSLALMLTTVSHLALAEPPSFEIGKSYNGFTLQQIGDLPNMSATAYLFEHDKTGARLLQVQNGDDNRAFSVQFKCPTPDDTGVKHIIEHCVLEGSEKYPVRGTFNELLRTSMASFLNAMTSDDATLYPFATRNMGEYYGLMDVYLNTVYHPLMYTDDKIMQKEGWRYMFNEDGSITFNGTVYNEMIGRNADASRRMLETSLASLFPDTPYRYNAGGVRANMPDLTQEALVAYHKEHFIPENSYMVAYGDLDTMELLDKLNTSCISDFERGGKLPEMPLQEPFDAQKELFDTLPAEAGMPETTGASLNYAYGEVADFEETLALLMLADVLTGSESAPLRAALTEAGFPQTQISCVTGQQISLMIQVMGGGLADTKLFREKVIEKLNRIVEEGFDKEYLEGALNNTKLNLKLQLMPGESMVGLSVVSWTLNAWLYGGNPIDFLDFDGMLDTLSEKALDGGYFEELIRKAMLDNPHSTFVQYVSDPTMKQREDAAIAAKAEEKTGGFTDAEKEELKVFLAELDAWSAATATPEQLEKLPRLTLADVDQSLIQQYNFIEKYTGDIKTLHNDYDTNGIAYVNLLFDTSSIAPESIPYLPLLCSMLGSTDTAQYTRAQLTTKLYQDTGSFGFFSTTYSGKEADSFTPYIEGYGYATIEKLTSMLDIAAEIAMNTKLSNASDVKATIEREISNWEMANGGMPIGLTMTRGMSYLTPESNYGDLTGGLAYYRFLTNLSANFDAKQEEILTALAEVSASVFTKENLMVSVTMNDDDYAAFEAALPGFVAQLNSGAVAEEQPPLASSAKNEGISGAFGGHTVFQIGKVETPVDSGAAAIAQKLINAYLMRVVRDQGGAYGSECGFVMDRNYIVFLSYYDPHLQETLDAFKTVPQMLRDLSLTQEEIEEYMKTSLNNYMYPMGPSTKGLQGLSLYMRGKNQQTLNEDVEKILSVRLEDIQALAEPIEQALNQNVICVAGPADSLNLHGELLDRIIPMIESVEPAIDELSPAA